MDVCRLILTSPSRRPVVAVEQTPKAKRCFAFTGQCPLRFTLFTTIPLTECACVVSQSLSTHVIACTMCTKNHQLLLFCGISRLQSANLVIFMEIR